MCLLSEFPVREAWVGSGRGSSLRTTKNAENVALLHDEQLLAIQLDLGPGPFAEEDPVAGLDIQGDTLAGFVTRTGADGDDLALLGLFLGAVRDDQTALGLLFFFDATDQDPVVQRGEIHWNALPFAFQRYAGRARIAAASAPLPRPPAVKLAAVSTRSRGVLTAAAREIDRAEIPVKTADAEDCANGPLFRGPARAGGTGRVTAGFAAEFLSGFPARFRQIWQRWRRATGRAS